MKSASDRRRRLPSASMIVAIVALVGVLAGGAYAGSKIGTSDIKNKAVTEKKIDTSAVTGKKIASAAVKGGKIKDGGVKGKKLDDSTLEKIDSIDGKQNSCESGAVLAYAQVELNPGAAFTPVDGFNCKGGTIEAKRNSAGNYDVRWENFVFDSTTDGIVVDVTAVGGSGGTITGYGTTASADLRVNTYDNAGTANDKLFSVTVFDAGPQE